MTFSDDGRAVRIAPPGLGLMRCLAICQDELVIRVLDDPALQPKDRRAAVRKFAHEIFDVAETAKRALARHWQARTQVEREEFTQIFADLLESTYIARMEISRPRASTAGQATG